MRPSECPKECKDKEKCVNYVGCGPDPCENPCWKCSFWTNYQDVLRKMLNEEAGDLCKGGCRCHNSDSLDTKERK